LTGRNTEGDEGSSTDNRIDADNLAGHAVQARHIRGGVDARSTNVNSRSTNISLPAVGVALGVVLALASFVVWRFAGADDPNASPTVNSLISSTTVPPLSTTNPTNQPEESGQCIEQHLDKAPKVLRPSRYQFPVGVQANVMTGSHDSPIAGILVRDGQTVGAIRLSYEHLGTGLQVLEVIDASCAAVQYSPPRRVTKDDYTTAFQIAGQAYEVAITTTTALFLDITFRLV